MHYFRFPRYAQPNIAYYENLTEVTWEFLNNTFLDTLNMPDMRSIYSKCVSQQISCLKGLHKPVLSSVARGNITPNAGDIKLL